MILVKQRDVKMFCLGAGFRDLLGEAFRMPHVADLDQMPVEQGAGRGM